MKMGRSVDGETKEFWNEGYLGASPYCLSIGNKVFE